MGFFPIYLSGAIATFGLIFFLNRKLSKALEEEYKDALVSPENEGIGLPFALALSLLSWVGFFGVLIGSLVADLVSTDKFRYINALFKHGRSPKE